MIKECSKGHFYDASVDSECPYCSGGRLFPDFDIFQTLNAEKFCNEPILHNEDFDSEPTNLLHNGDFYEKQHVVLRDKYDTDRIWKGFIFYHLNIGCDRRCGITIPGDYDDAVKPLHCRIIKKIDSSFYIVILKLCAKNNNTLLNGHHIGVEHPRQIHPGDELTIGRHTYLVDFE